MPPRGVVATIPKEHVCLGARALEDGSSIEHFARMVSPLHWKDVCMAMLTVCYDGAGKDTPEHKVLAVAGFASFAGMWTEFTQKWEARLKEDELPYFHAGKFAHSTGPFSEGWKDDESRRQALASDLMSIIRECGLRKFDSMIRLEDFRYSIDKHADELKNWPLLEVFAVTAMRAVEAFQAYARREGITRNIRYVFDKGDPEDQLRTLFREYGFAEPDFTWSKPNTDRKGFSHDPFVGLQAAGWVTYEYYLDAARMLYSTPTDRWAFQEFESIPGHIHLETPSPSRQMPPVWMRT
ncbi:MAG: hypothetical protein ACJ74Z_06870 [Bryobacteraceae bacterium]